LFYLTRFGSRREKEGFHLVRDHWNDFGFCTLFELYHVDSKREKKIGYVKIGLKGQIEGYTRLNEQFMELSDKHFSLGQSVDFYSNLRELGDDLRVQCLTSLRDLAYNEDIFKEVIEEESVEKSLLRDLNVRIVTNQFRRVAHGGAILTDYNFNFRMPFGEMGDDEVFNFRVIPESLPPTNIHAIIGTNGTGKTTALNGILKGYLENDLEEEFSNAIFISFSIFDKKIYEPSSTNSHKSIVKNYHCVEVRDSELGRKDQSGLRKKFADSIKEILSKRRQGYLKSMIEVLNADSNLESFGFIEILERFEHAEREQEKMEKAIEQCSKEYGQVFDKLSSGHQIVLMSIAKIVEFIVEKTLILIDEPEIHLHPPLLSAFVRALSKVTISENAVAILATHSPVVLQEVPKSCVSIMHKHGNRVNIQKPRFETFGENVGILTEEVFGLEIPKTGFHTLLRKIVEESPVYEDVVHRFNNELSIEAKAIVRTYINKLSES